MALNQQQKANINDLASVFKNYLRSGTRKDDLSERRSRVELFSQLLSPEAIDQMSELEFGKVISSLWASLMWGNKSYLVDKLLQDNDLQNLKRSLTALLWGEGSIPKRYDKFRNSTKGFGSAMITEILAFTHPEQCGLWNDKARKALAIMGFKATFPIIKKSQISGSEYQDFNNLLGEIRDELENVEVGKLDLLGVDYFLFEIWKTDKERGGLFDGPDERITKVELEEDFEHDEIIDHLVAIGQWLGFETEKEKKIARGARVDAVWQARIANLGVVTYVFEVQRKGSVDSLILNLQRAQNNPSVQKLIVVANTASIREIKREIETLPESFRRAVEFMEVAESIRLSELLEELSTIINKLDLVQSEFGV